MRTGTMKIEVMLRRITAVFITVFMWAVPFSGYGGDGIKEGDTLSRTVSTPVYFRIGKSAIDPAFMGNREHMDRFVNALREILSDSDYVVSKIRVVGMASPDGSRGRNEELAGARARSLADFLVRETGIAADKIDVVNGGENWDGLFAMIEASTELPDKAKMLEFRELYKDDRDRLKRNMQFYNGSQAWLYMYEHFFPTLRMGVSKAEDELRRGGAAGASPDAGQVEPADTGMSFTFEASPEAQARLGELRAREDDSCRTEELELREDEQRHSGTETVRAAAVSGRRRMEPVMALKTDFVLWGGVMPGFEMGSFMPNLSAEVYFAKRWSVQLGGAYGNWDALGGDYGLYAVTAVDLEPRWWLKDNGLFRGFYAGIFGTYGDFDVQEASTGFTGTYFMGGVTGGWSQMVGRRLCLEAALRLGFRSAKGDNYTILNDHYYLGGSESRGKFAPQVRLQLMYRFGKSGK